jgi:integrase
MSRYQHGHVYEAFNAFHVQYYQTKLHDGKPVRVRKSHRLCAKDRIHYSTTAKAVQKLCADHMASVNEDVAIGEDMTVAQFWTKYLHYCEHEWKGRGMKPSTIRGFRQIWQQFLEGHFGELTVQEYTSDHARRLLSSLKTLQVKSTLQQIRSVAGAMFRDAEERRYRTAANPWRIKIPEDCKEAEDTRHYTMEEAETIVSALIDHVDAQLVIALSCFLGLRPSEIAAVRWEDFDRDSVHIRRNVVRGIVGTPKTKESIATIPLIDQVRVPLELWRQNSAGVQEGWVFPSRNDTPVDLHNLVARVMRPHVEGVERCWECDRVPKTSGVAWKSLYAGRRGACTAVIEATGGNYAIAQALLRHKSMTTTLNVYKKAITPDAFRSGMKLLERSIEKNEPQ